MPKVEYDLPQHWEFVPLEELAARNRNALAIGPFGSNLKVKDYRSEGVPLVFVRDIRRERFGDSSTKFVSPEKAAELASHTTVAGDLLVTKMGDPPGDTTVYPGNRRTAVITADCIKLTPDRQLTSSEFLKYCLRTEPSRERILDETQGVAQQKLSLQRFRQIEIPLPPINEQGRIVAKLEALQERTRNAREALKAIPPLIEKFRQSILAAAFRGDLTADWRAKNPDVEPAAVLLDRICTERRRKWEDAELAKLKARGKTPTDDRWKSKYEAPAPIDRTDLPELPDGWCWAVADELVEPDAEIVYGIVQPGPEIADGIPYVRGMDIENGVILVNQLRRTSAEIAARYERASLRGGDVLLGIIRATKVAVVPPELLGANITQGTARFRPGSEIRTDFLAAWLESKFAQDWLHDRYRGIDMPGLNLRDVRRLPVPLCSSSEQNLISERVAAQKQSIATVEEQAASSFSRLQDLQNAILAAAFRGELVPQDPNDEPASVLLERIRIERERQQPQASRGRRTRR